MSVPTQNVFRPVQAIAEKVGHFSAYRPNSGGQRNPQPVVDDLRSGHVVEILRDWRAPGMALSVVRLERHLIPARTQVVMDFLASLPFKWEV
jgi:hypothetical protein